MTNLEKHIQEYTPTLQERALARLNTQRDAQQTKDAKAQASDDRLRQEHGSVLRIFQRDILGAKLPTGTRIDSIIHGHRVSVLYADSRSIVAEHLFRVVNDSLVVTVFEGLTQRWIAKKRNARSVREKSFEDFLDAFIWLFRSELRAMAE